MTPSRRSVRHRALLAAVAATSAVAFVLLCLLGVTDLLVARNLTAGVDNHLRDRLSRPLLPVENALDLQAEDGDFDEPLLEWVITPVGTVTSAAETPPLPAGLRSVSDPVTGSVAGARFRLAGASLPGGDRLVVAASMAPTDHAVSTLLITEALAAPALLVLVFGGALLLGSRVAGPIERMRQTQLAFTADASHQLRTPLSVITAETSLARTGSPAEMRGALERVASEATRMRGIVDDLLWLARFDAEPQGRPKLAVDLVTIATMTAQRFAAVAQRRDIAISVEPPDSEPVFVTATPEWLDHLAGILVDNACRYSPAGGRVQVSVTVRDGRAELAVVDNGPGIPGPGAETLFHRFQRGTDDGEGFGLGLAIADAIVHATAGRWDVQNRESGGARFAISWTAERGLAETAAGSGVTASRR